MVVNLFYSRVFETESVVLGLHWK